MADYKPLLTRAIAALPADTAEARAAVYQRAREALGRQFGNPAAAIPPEVAERELANLEQAIAALEGEREPPAGDAPVLQAPAADGATAAPAAPPAPAEAPQVEQDAPVPPVPAAPPAPVEPVAQAQAPAARAERPALPPLPPLPPRVPRPAGAPAASVAPLPTAVPPASPERSPEPPPVPPSRTAERAEAEDGEPPATPARPKAPRREGRSGGGLKIALLVIGGLVVAGVGTFAWLRRNEPAATATAPPVRGQRPPAAIPPVKVEERVGGDPGPSRPAPLPAPAPAPPAAAPPSPVQPAPIAIANRLIFIEEGRDNPANVVVRQGSAVWRIDTISGGQGQPLETVIRVDLDIPEARLKAEMTMRRNRDRAFPASHTIELRFTAQPGNEIGPLAQLNVVEARQVENQPGFPMVGQGITVMENVFLIALAAADQLAERNLEMLRQRPWIYMEAQLVSGRRIAMVFEKGVSGQQVFEDALRTW
jgi:hypothetical protein